MSFQTLPPPFRHPERSNRHSSMLSDFERFYRTQLRRVAGQRLRSMDVSKWYEAWALREDAAPIGFKDMKRCMAVVGHQLLRTNGMFFVDVALASMHPEIADNLPPIGPEAISMLPPCKSRRRPVNLEELLAAIARDLALIRSHILGGGDVR